MKVSLITTRIKSVVDMIPKSSWYLCRHFYSTYDNWLCFYYFYFLNIEKKNYWKFLKYSFKVMSFGPVTHSVIVAKRYTNLFRVDLFIKILLIVIMRCYILYLCFLFSHNWFRFFEVQLMFIQLVSVVVLCCFLSLYSWIIFTKLQSNTLYSFTLLYYLHLCFICIFIAITCHVSFKFRWFLL